ncbi:hypothetical protein MC885_000100 [Smutsia gigantea]|nr:hypothetical protein MC885_000100 [Smutsia gigantea]
MTVPDSTSCLLCQLQALRFCCGSGTARAAGLWAMSPHLTTLLGLAICVGRPVTIECHSSTGFDTFRLEKEGTASHSDVKNPLHGKVARFPIPAADEDPAGRYYCVYHKGSWSERSELLELRVTGDMRTHAEDSNDGGPRSTTGTEQMPQERASPAVDTLERTPGPQEVTYAQLDHRMPTQMVAQAAFPQSAEPTAESSTYAALARH